MCFQATRRPDARTGLAEVVAPPVAEAPLEEFRAEDLHLWGAPSVVEAPSVLDDPSVVVAPLGELGPEDRDVWGAPPAVETPPVVEAPSVVVVAAVLCGWGR